jgi:hypothetical protein
MKMTGEVAGSIFRKKRGASMSDEKTFEREYQHRGSKPKELRAAVMEAEREAELALGGPVRREHQFLDPQGERCRFIWRLK